MTRDDSDLALRVATLLADPAHAGHPLHAALAQLWRHHQEQQQRLDRVTRLSDAYQGLARQREADLGERFGKQLRQLEKLARISDRYQHMMRDLNTALNEASNRDVLTGLGNRRLLVERLKEATRLAEAGHPPYSLIMLDVDHFKQVNDTYGHEVGDQVLIAISNTIRASMPERGSCGRWGGEEFLIVLPQASGAEACDLAARIRAEIQAQTLRAGDRTVSVSASLGVSTHRAGEAFSQTVNRADAALLEAKRTGRNRVVRADEQADTAAAGRATGEPVRP